MDIVSIVSLGTVPLALGIAFVLYQWEARHKAEPNQTKPKQSTSPSKRIFASSSPTQKSPSGVFITYRRNDQAGFAGRLGDRLADHFGKEKIFRDVDSMPLGYDFREVIETQLAQCDVMLVVIGHNWLNAISPNGLRRLDDPDDLVCFEIAAGLAREGVRVIPILVDGVSVPESIELPDSLRGLARRHGLNMSNANFNGDLEMLLTELG